MTAPPDPFAFVVDGPPISSQTRRKALKHNWTATVRAAAATALPAGTAPHAGPVAVEILYLHDPLGSAGPKPLDVDNVPKPVLDGLKGVVYVDDAAVANPIVIKRDRTAALNFGPGRPSATVRAATATEFLHVSVRPLSNPPAIP